MTVITRKSYGEDREYAKEIDQRTGKIIKLTNNLDEAYRVVGEWKWKKAELYMYGFKFEEIEVEQTSLN